MKNTQPKGKAVKLTLTYTASLDGDKFTIWLDSRSGVDKITDRTNMEQFDRFAALVPEAATLQARAKQYVGINDDDPEQPPYATVTTTPLVIDVDEDTAAQLIELYSSIRSEIIAAADEARRRREAAAREEEDRKSEGATYYDGPDGDVGQVVGWSA